MPRRTSAWLRLALADDMAATVPTARPVLRDTGGRLLSLAPDPVTSDLAVGSAASAAGRAGEVIPQPASRHVPDRLIKGQRSRAHPPPRAQSRRDRRSPRHVARSRQIRPRTATIAAREEKHRDHDSMLAPPRNRRAAPLERLGMTTRRVAWRRSDEIAADEHCTFTRRDSGLSLVGTVLGAEDGLPVRIEYRILTDADGMTTAAHVRDLRGFEQRRSRTCAAVVIPSA